ncbi:MAG: SIMPL domain-containing protein [Bacillota bacterium]|nr:SIMPL domain-containing protein [Bacillota bacterium]
MKKIITALLVFTLIFSLTLTAFAEDEGKLTVPGSYTVLLQADTATIEIGARTQAKTVAKAQEENNAIMDALIKKLTEMGYTSDDIRTTQFYIGFEQDYSYSSLSQQNENDNFVVTNMIAVTVRDLSKLSQVIDAAAAAGANNAYNLTFSSSKTKEAYYEALKLAVEDAAEKAKVLAQAGGRELGEILTMEASDGFRDYGFENRMVFAEDSAKATPILPGNLSLTANVSITFELK